MSSTVEELLMQKLRCMSYVVILEIEIQYPPCLSDRDDMLRIDKSAHAIGLCTQASNAVELYMQVYIHMKTY
jgi:hypothetical protein